MTRLTCMLATGALVSLLACAGGGDTPRGAAAEPGAASMATPATGAVSGGRQDPQPLTHLVQLTVTAEMDGKSYRVSGPGECNYTTDASIYEVPASMWSARFNAAAGDLTYVNLTLWQPKAAPDIQVSLGLTTAGSTHEIATVKGAPTRGSASGRVEPAGSGGALRVEGLDAGGRRIRLQVDCSRFTEPVAEGG